MPYAGINPRLYWTRSGAGEEPMLFITGFTISSAVFDPVLPLYEDRFECVTYDNRSSGRSDAPLRLTSMPEFAGDAVRVLDAAGIQSAHVYGLSMGGMIAQELAIRFPERVRGLVLGCSTPGGPRAALPSLRQIAALGGGAAKGLTEPGRPMLARMLFSPEFRREHPERVRELLHFFAAHRAKAHGITAHWWASVYHDTTERLHRIQAPTLIFHGAADTMAPLANAHLLAARIPDAEVAVIEGTGHAYLLEDPEGSRDRLYEWLDRRGPIAPGTANRGIAAATEPLTRAFGLPVGTFRTGRSLIALARDRLAGRPRERDTPSG
jgi:3-oxoadipate enol-lactonase